jgi:hypothetical protein
MPVKRTSSKTKPAARTKPAKRTAARKSAATKTSAPKKAAAKKVAARAATSPKTTKPATRAGGANQSVKQEGLLFDVARSIGSSLGTMAAKTKEIGESVSAATGAVTEHVATRTKELTDKATGFVKKK